MAAAWKSILIIWFVMLLVTAAVVSPVKGALYAGFDRSMITEKLGNGLIPEVFTDLGPALESIMASFRSGFMTLILISFILNAFFTGGLFDVVRRDSEGSSLKNFFSGCVRNFWSYLVLIFLSILLFFFIVLLISFVPALFIDKYNDHVEKSVFMSAIISIVIFILVLPVLLLITDYARAWKAANIKAGVFGAFGKGVSLTFGNFMSSWTMMFIIIILNGLYMWLVVSVVPGLRPATGAGVFLVFLSTQLMFMIRLWLKFYRYSCVTALMEQKTKNVIIHQI